MDVLTSHSKETGTVETRALPASALLARTNPPDGHVATEGRSVQDVIAFSPVKWLGVSGGLGVVALVTFMVCLGFGTEAISFPQVASLLVQGVVAEGGAQDNTQSIILWQVRVPRVLLAFMVGGSLAAVGASLQALLRNPLADPYVIGISSGAALGAAVAILFGVGLSVFRSLSVAVFVRFSGVGFALHRLPHSRVLQEFFDFIRSCWAAWC